MRTNLKQLVATICSNFKLDKVILLSRNPEIEGVLNYHKVNYVIASRDLEEGFCFDDAADFTDFMADFDMAIVDTYGSYIFKYRLLHFLSDVRLKFIINDTKAVDFKDSSYIVSRFRNNGRDYKIHYLDILEEAFARQDLAEREYR